MTDRTSHSKVHEVTDENQFALVASPQLLLTEVLERLAALEEENQQLRAEAARQDGEIAALKEDLRGFGVWTAPQKVEDLWEWVEDLEKATTTTATPPTGQKTTARIEELKAKLKMRRGGRAPFEELRMEMGLSKSQFSKLTGHLDKRIFDIQRHPRKAREKVLILRQQIG